MDTAQSAVKYSTLVLQAYRWNSPDTFLWTTFYGALCLLTPVACCAECYLENVWNDPVSRGLCDITNKHVLA